MVKQFILLKQFTQSSNKGFTLLELLVTLVVASVITGLALKLIVDQRQLFLNDQSRTQVNQNLRASLDLVGTDIKQAGERLTTSALPVVRVINGSATDPKVPDELVLQRLVIAESLPVCKTVTIGTTTSEIEVSQKGGVGLCSASFSSSTATLPITLSQWKDSRCSKDGDSTTCRTVNVDRTTTSKKCVEEKDGTDKECIWAYIYDPDTNKGEFFLYGFESPKDTPDTATNTYRVHRVDGEAWKNTYPYAVLSATNPTNPILYIMEERKYSLSPDKVLQLTLNGQANGQTSTNFLVDGQSSPIRLVNQLDNFQVKALMQSGNTPLTRDNFNNTAIDNWKQLKAVNVSFTAKNPASDSTKVPNLTVSAQFFPRNVSSK